LHIPPRYEAKELRSEGQLIFVGCKHNVKTEAEAVRRAGQPRMEAKPSNDQVDERKPRRRYGIGEWYGKIFAAMSTEERAALTELQFLEKRDRKTQPCPFKHGVISEASICSKIGGVCTLRLYESNPTTAVVSPASGVEGSLVTTCPHRFKQNGKIYNWIGEILLNTSNPIIASEVGFLKRSEGGLCEAPQDAFEDVGRIDNVLVHPLDKPLTWCALELQAVYFSGSAMKTEFEAMRKLEVARLLFPVAHRRPDFRSSGPKRLMPQLQIKVPTLRRWGKKMAVVVDRPFFESLGKMEEVKDVSSCDIAWFIVQYEEKEDGRAELQPHVVKLTTLERAVEGLTGGTPLSLTEFEARIRAKVTGEI